MNSRCSNFNILKSYSIWSCKIYVEKTIIEVQRNMLDTPFSIDY